MVRPVRASSLSTLRRRIWASPELVCVILIIIYISLIFIIPPAVNVYFDAADRRADDQRVAGAGIQSNPDPQYRLERR